MMNFSWFQGHSPSIVLLLTMLSVCFIEAGAQVSASLSHAVPYMWRGEKLSSGFVLQPSVDIDFAGFNVNLFGNLDPNGGLLGNAFHFNEADVATSYSQEISPGSMSVGYILYTFPTPGVNGLAWHPTQEVFFQLETIFPLAPSIFVSYDFDGDKSAGDIKGIYAEIAISESYAVGELELTYSNSVGLDAGYVLPASSFEISHFITTISASVEIDGVTLAPLFGLQITLDRTYKESFGGYMFFGGLGLGF